MDTDRLHSSAQPLLRPKQRPPGNDTSGHVPSPLEQAVAFLSPPSFSCPSIDRARCTPRHARSSHHLDGRGAPATMGGGFCCSRRVLAALSGFACLGLLFLLVGVVGTGLGKRRVVCVDDFGAAGDGLTDDTQAFKKAWDAACSLHSRTVLEIPAGKTYLIGPIDLDGHCPSRVVLQISGTVIAPKDPAVWNGLDPHKWLYFQGINHLTVNGGGTINGMGEQWWARSCKTNKTNPCRHAPTAITFHKCNHLKIHDLMSVNSQQMHIAVTNSSHVKMSSLKVIAPATSPNTDGIHISGCTSVRVQKCIIRTGDDCISIVNDTSKVRINNIVCGPGHGISVGSLGKFNSSAKVHSVTVDGAFISNTENGLRIKTWQGGHGFARDIKFRNVLMKNVSHPILIDQYYCDSSHPCANQTDAVRISKISFVNIKGTSARQEAMKFACSDTYPCEDIVLQDIQLSSESEGKNVTASCWKAGGFSFGTIEPPSCLSEWSRPPKHEADADKVDGAFFLIEKEAAQTWSVIPLLNRMNDIYRVLLKLGLSEWDVNLSHDRNTVPNFTEEEILSYIGASMTANRSSVESQ